MSDDQQAKVVEAGNRKLLSSKRKLDQPQDLTAPDIVTWLPVLLSTGSQTPQQSNLTNGCNEAPTTNETQIIAQDEQQNGQKTLGQDGLVFRSPEMKRSLQRKKKKMKKSKNRPADPRNPENSSSQDSDNSDSFYETLRKHQRKNRNNSSKTNNNNSNSSSAAKK